MRLRGRTLRPSPAAFRQRALQEQGQELVEFALLTLLVMAIGSAVFVALQSGMGSAYVTWGTAIFDNWQPSAPAP